MNKILIETQGDERFVCFNQVLAYVYCWRSKNKKDFSALSIADKASARCKIRSVNDRVVLGRSLERKLRAKERFVDGTGVNVMTHAMEYNPSGRAVFADDTPAIEFGT